MVEQIVKKRQANFEVLRIVAMLMIITHHFLMYGGIFSNITPGNWKYYAFHIIEYSCLIAVNIYIMITGYFQIQSKVKMKKIIYMELQMIFYSVILYIISISFNKIEFNTITFLKTFFPFITKKYWFMTAYMGLYLIIPFFNKFVNLLNKKEYTNLLFLLLLLLSIVPSIFPLNDIFDRTGGYSLIWFIVLYLLGGYIKLYLDSKVFLKRKLLLINIAVIFIQMIIRVICLNVKGVNLLKNYLSFSNSYNNILLVIETVAFFLLFKQITVKNKYIEKIVLKISPLTLGVYLIHEHVIFKRIIWDDILHPSRYLINWKIFLVLIIDVVLIFLTTCLIEKIRVIMFKVFKIDRIVEKINKILNRLYLKLEMYFI